MATVNKNFKVKNGLEVGTTTVVASIDSSGNANIAGNLTANTGFVSADTFRLDTTFTGGTTQPGEIAWDVDEGTVMFQLADGAVTHRIGQQLDIRVVNNTGSTISEGAVVYINGSSGQEPTIALANAATEGASSKTIGVVTHQGGIANAASGYICISGIMRGVDVGAYAAGTPLWLSNVAGVFTDTKPIPPENGVFIGWVVKAGNAGSILVAIQNGYEVDELHDVKYTSLATNDILQRTANNLWENKTLAGANIANLAASTVTFAGNVVATTNVNATTFNGSGAGLTSIPNSATTANSANGASTIVARDSNGSFVANAINSTTVTATGIVTGLELTSTNSSGLEGGQVNLAKPATTSLSGNVIVDIYENKIRFFDSAGTNRGAYIDLTAAGAGVGTNLLGGVTGAMNASYTYATKQSNVSSAGTILANVAITTNGYPIQVIATGDMENNSAGGWVVLQLYRDSTAIGNVVHAESSAGSENVPFALTAIDVPAAGTYTYSLKIVNSAGGTFNFGETDGPVITVVELSGPKGDTGAAGAAGDSFKTISTPSGTSPVADSATDTLTLLAGNGITITGNATADSVTITADIENLSPFLLMGG